MRANGTMNPAIVGKSVETVAKLAGLDGVPATARVLVARETGVGRGVAEERPGWEGMSPSPFFQNRKPSGVGTLSSLTNPPQISSENTTEKIIP